MPVARLREITLGVKDLEKRAAEVAGAWGLEIMRQGSLDAMTAGRLFDAHKPPRGAMLGTPGGPGRIRLIETRPDAEKSEGSPAGGAIGIELKSAGRDARARGFEEAGMGSVRTVECPSTTDFPDSPRAIVSGLSDDGDAAIARIEATSSTAGAVWFAVTNLDACVHFAFDTLGQQPVRSGPHNGRLPLPPFLETGAFEAAVSSADDDSLQLIFVQYERRLTPMPQRPSLARGLCRVRVDTQDLDRTLGRVPGGGGSLVRGPAGVDDPILGAGLVALVRSPFGVLMEIWQPA